MVTRIFFFLTILTTFSFAECTNFKSYKANNKNDFYKSLKNISIDVNNSQKFFKKAARYYIAVNSKGTEKAKNAPKYQDRYKKKIKANITFEMKNGDACTFKGTLRGHGDIKSHFDLVNGVPISSYRIKLEEGNFNNITRFILFRPKSRYHDNEIFVSTLLRQLGFLSPRTFKVKIKINNIVSDYIFQENLKKEFLEKNNKIEGPILEANENLEKFNKLSLARLQNKEWIKGLEQNYLISLNAIKNFNFHRLAGFAFRIKSANYKNTLELAIDETLRFNKKNLTSGEYKKIGTFQAYMSALGASHGLSYDDQRFYYDPIYSTIEPIYYDGDADILSAINYDPYTGKFNKNLENWKKIKDINLDFTDYENKSFRYNLKNQVVTVLARDNANLAIKKLKKIDKSNLLLELKHNGFENLSLNQLESLIRFINQRLLKISQSKVKEEIQVDKSIYKKYEKEMNIDKDLDLIFLDDLLISEGKKYLSLEICDYKLLNCYKTTVNEEILIDLIEQNNFLKKNNSFLAMTKNEYKDGKINKLISIPQETYKINNFSNGINVMKNKKVEVNFDDKRKIINIDFYKKSGRVVIFKSNLDSWKIYMKNKTTNENETILDNKKITGCLTIIDSNFEKLEIYANSFFCEDTVNFIRSKGVIDKIDISNSLSDALDADFSKLIIKDLIINQSKNDCVDFSFGEYQVYKADLQNCGDKAVSLGEKSKINIENVFIKNSKYGLVSKDSSHLIGNKIKIKNTEVCIAAYNKKQEFGGSLIELSKDYECTNFLKSEFKDKNSKIVSLNE